MNRRAMTKSPAAFRRLIRIENDQQELQPLPELLESWQVTDFAALDPAWRKLAGHDVDPPYQRAWIERPRGHSKTSDMALQLAWILLFGRPELIGFAAAADADQAALIREAIHRLAQWNDFLFRPLEFQRELVRNTANGGRLKIIASDVGSSYGVLPDFIICDELCHWEKPDLWHSLLSSAAKKPDCLLAVLTNAGVGRDWQWDIREMAQESGHWYFTSLDGPQASWIKSEWLEEQRHMLPDPVYRRLWLNQWQHSDGEFLTLAEAEACRDESLTPQTHGQPHCSYIAAIDYAEKHDLTVGVLIHWEHNRLIVDRMDVRKPSPERPTRVHWVDDWIAMIVENFHRVTFILDEYQMVGTIQRYESQYDVLRFNFAAGQGNHALAIALRRVILQRQIAWYPGCGQIEKVDVRDDLETELASLLLKQQPSGRCRIDHLPDGLHHDDRSFALGAAVLHALDSGGVAEWLEIDNSPGLW
jgi:hypothetical protein